MALDHQQSPRLGQRRVVGSTGALQVATKADLPENAFEGQLARVLDTSELWVFEEDTWEKVANAGGGTNLVFTQETFILPMDGAQGIRLAHEPIKGSEHVYWFGLYQEEGDAWISDEDMA